MSRAARLRRGTSPAHRALRLASLAALALAAGLAGCDAPVVDTDVSDVETCPSGCPASACLPEGGCALEACTQERGCAQGFYCDAEIGYCREGCEIGQLCADGRVCSGSTENPAARFCTVCDSRTLPCPSGTGVCTEGRCVACTGDAQCGLGTGRICAANFQCVEGCRGEENCPTDQRCDLTRALCVECYDDAHCGTGTCNVEQGVCQ